MVADSKGVKMSKSKGNVINPIELIDKYGADALRMSLLYGTPAGSKVILSEDKVRGMRNFSNKIWNAARFLQSLELETGDYSHDPIVEGSIDQWIHDVTNYLEQYKFDKAIEYLYTTLWHVYCDDYIEKAKKGLISKPVMDKAFRVLITLLHPFAPFVTEAIWQEYSQQSESSLLATTAWPTS
jgi:valyl-tRNA synthetase